MRVQCVRFALLLTHTDSLSPTGVVLGSIVSQFGPQREDINSRKKNMTIARSIRTSASGSCARCSNHWRGFCVPTEQNHPPHKILTFLLSQFLLIVMKTNPSLKQELGDVGGCD